MALEITVASGRIQSRGCGELNRQLMRVAGTIRSPVLPGSPGIEAANKRSRFDGHKQSSRDVRIRFDPSDVVCLRSRWKTPFAGRGKSGQVAAFVPGFATIFGTKNRTRFGPGIDNTAIVHSLGSSDRYGLNFRVLPIFYFTRPTCSLLNSVSQPLCFDLISCVSSGVTGLPAWIENVYTFNPITSGSLQTR